MISTNEQLSGGEPAKTYVLKPYGDERQQYIEYLLKRLTEFRRAGQSFGQKTGGVSVVVTRKIIQAQVGVSLDDASRFEEICAFIKTKIDATILGKRNTAINRPNYHGVEDHGEAVQPLVEKPAGKKFHHAALKSESVVATCISHAEVDGSARGTNRVELPGNEPVSGNRTHDEQPSGPVVSAENILPAGERTPVPVLILTDASAKTGARWQATLDAYNKLVSDAEKQKQESPSYPAAAAILGVSVPTLFRIVTVYAKRSGADGGSLTPDLKNCGRKPPVLPTPEELACVKQIYEKLDESKARGKGLGSSKVTAYRLAAKSEDPRIGDVFRAVVLKRNRKSVPPSWERLLEVPASVIDCSRDSRTTTAHYINTPRGRAFINEAGAEIPLRAGTIFEADDATFNFYATIPWPFGGDKCSDKFGVRLGRWQLLATVDARWEFCPSFDIVARNLGSYRGEDSAALIGRTMAEECMPELWRLERGSWESKAVRGALDLCQQRVQNAWHSKQKSAVERFFDRLWTPLSLIPGHVGRDRARMKQMQDIAGACQDGRRDPREIFLPLDDATNRVVGAIQFVNGEPIESKSGWGRWIPEERYTAQMKEQPARRLDDQYKVFFAREQRVWTVRGCTIGGPVDGPLIKFPIYFQHEALWEFEGCKVKAYFDPYQPEVTGTLVLQEAWRDHKAGTIIARDVPALDLPPQFVLSADGWAGAEDQQRQLAVRKAIAKAVRTEMWNFRGGRRTEARDGFGNTAMRNGQPAAVLQPARGEAAPTIQTPARDIAAPSTANRQRGLLAPQTPAQISRQSDRNERLAARSRQLAEMQET